MLQELAGADDVRRAIGRVREVPFVAGDDEIRPGGVSAPLAVLLNRVGVTGSNPSGYGDAGFNITLSGSGTDIHSYGGNSGNQLTGTWTPDGRNIDPNSSGADFDSADRTKLLSQFNDSNPNGAWTVTFSDWVSSGDPSTLVGWSLNITAVPERSNAALAVFGMILGGFGLRRRLARLLQ